MRSARILKATAALLLTSCSPLFQDCTAMACLNGLAVRFSTVPTGAWSVEAWSDQLPGPVSVQCPAGIPCEPVFFQNFEGEHVTVRVTTDAGELTQEFDVEYETVYPNGRDCPGRCRQAEVVVQL
jgi:hypothetical protein